MINQTNRWREKAKELNRIITDCMNSDVTHCYKPGNERCDVQKHLEQALIDVSNETQKEYIERAAPYLPNALQD